MLPVEATPFPLRFSMAGIGGVYTSHTWPFGRIARLPRSGTVLALLAIGIAMTRRAALPRNAGDALCFPENPSVTGILRQERLNLLSLRVRSSGFNKDRKTA
jgi:hypothetical protein